jgi:hypothetical protein
MVRFGMHERFQEVRLVFQSPMGSGGLLYDYLLWYLGVVS